MTIRLTKEFRKFKNNHIPDNQVAVAVAVAKDNDQNNDNNDIIDNLQNKWQLANNQNYYLQVSFRKIDLSHYLLTIGIIYKENRILSLLKSSYLGIPKYLNHQIISYLPEDETLNLSFLISYPEKYPFNEPNWTLIEAVTNSKLLIDPFHYYSYLIKMRNELYQTSYQASITMEKDMFDFTCHINNFNYLRS